MEFITQPLFLIIIFSILILANLVLFFTVFKLKSHYNSLTSGVTKKKLLSVLEGIQKTLASHERAIEVNKKTLIKHADKSKLYLQNISLKRFNPFSDTGGDQSFILAILDGNQDGAIITSLHSRENTRFYIKSIKAGRGVNHPLSKEEQKVIK